MKATPENIKACRKELGLTQAQAADLFNVSRLTWFRWENHEKPISSGRQDQLTPWIKSVKDAAVHNALKETEGSIAHSLGRIADALERLAAK